VTFLKFSSAEQFYVGIMRLLATGQDKSINRVHQSGLIWFVFHLWDIRTLEAHLQFSWHQSCYKRKLCHVW